MHNLLRSLPLLLCIPALSNGCGPREEMCGATNCSGCCSAEGRCETGSLSYACGARGSVCEVCATNQGKTCVLGACGTSAAGGGAGGGGSAACQANTCGTCTPLGGCGWCNSTNQCSAGTASGPTGSSCSNWAYVATQCSGAGGSGGGGAGGGGGSGSCVVTYGSGGCPTADSLYCGWEPAPVRNICCPSTHAYWCDVTQLCYSTSSGATAACGSVPCYRCVPQVTPPCGARGDSCTGNSDCCMNLCCGDIQGCC